MALYTAMFVSICTMLLQYTCNYTCKIFQMQCQYGLQLRLANQSHTQLHAPEDRMQHVTEWKRADLETSRGISYANSSSASISAPSAVNSPMSNSTSSTPAATSASRAASKVCTVCAYSTASRHWQVQGMLLLLGDCHAVITVPL